MSVPWWAIRTCLKMAALDDTLLKTDSQCSCTVRVHSALASCVALPPASVQASACSPVLASSHLRSPDFEIGSIYFSVRPVAAGVFTLIEALTAIAGQLPLVVTTGDSGDESP